MDRVEKLTEANEDRDTLQHTIARLTAKHFEEAERRRDCEKQIVQLKAQMQRDRDETKKLGAKYLREVEHRSSLQDEIMALRSRVQRLETEAVSLLTDRLEAREALEVTRNDLHGAYILEGKGQLHFSMFV